MIKHERTNNADGNSPAQGDLESLYRKLGESLGVSKDSLQSLRRAILGTLMAERKEGLHHDPEFKEIYESVRFRITKELQEIFRKRPDLASLTESGVLIFNAFSPRSNEELSRQSFESLATINKSLAVSLLLLKLETIDTDPEAIFAARLLEKIDPHTLFGCIISGGKEDDIELRKKLIECLAPPVREKVIALGLIDPTSENVPKLSKALPELMRAASENPGATGNRAEELKESVRVLEFLDRWKRTPSLKELTSSFFVEALLKLAPTVSENHVYGIGIGCAVIGLTERELLKNGGQTVAKMVSRWDRELGALLSDFFKRD